jgi:hypothetical protein
MTAADDIRREISYWTEFRDALEIALLKQDKSGMLHSRAIERVERLKRTLRAREAREIIESQSRPSEILQDQEGHDTTRTEA